MVGIASDASGVGVSSGTQRTLIVKIDGTETMRETISVVNPILPILLDLPVADASRVELVFTDVNVPFALADLRGHQG